MADIKTLVPDIYEFLSDKREPSDTKLDSFLASLKELLKRRLSGRDNEFTLRMSNLGEACDRKQWLMKHKPESIEKLSPNVLMKFLYGDIIEMLVLYLAKEAGHDVKSEQLEVEIGGVKGHIDAIIDGHLVDVKSTTSFGMKKFRDNGLKFDDPFGYLTQLHTYLMANKENDDVEVKKEASFVAVDKALGHVELATYRFPSKDFLDDIERKKEVLESPEVPPRFYQPVAFGKSGNAILCTECSYCPVKAACHPGLRTFIYHDGPKFFTRVVDEPRVPEVNA